MHQGVCRFQIDCNQPGDTLLLHGDADKMLRKPHCNFVVCHEDELRHGRHLSDQATEPLGVGIIKRRIDLIEQAKGSGVELKQRKDQGRGSQGLLTTREQVNRCVFLARGAAP